MSNSFLSPHEVRFNLSVLGDGAKKIGLPVGELVLVADDMPGRPQVCDDPEGNTPASVTHAFPFPIESDFLKLIMESYRWMEMTPSPLSNTEQHRTAAARPLPSSCPSTPPLKARVEAAFAEPITAHISMGNFLTK
jgi:hypothetical protein